MEKGQLKLKLDSILKKANLPKKTEEIAEMEKLTFDPTFWSDSQSASKIMKKINGLKKEKDDVEMMQLLLEDNQLEEAEKLINKYEVLLPGILNGKNGVMMRSTVSWEMKRE